MDNERSAGFFVCSGSRQRLRKGNHMKNNTDGSDRSDDVIICTDETGMQLFLSEKAANRLSWILTGIFILLSLPVIILAFVMI